MLKSFLFQCNGRHHQLFDSYGISFPQMIAHMFLLSKLQSRRLFPNVTLRIGTNYRACTNISERCVPGWEQDTHTLPGHQISTQSFGGVHVTQSLFSMLCFPYYCLSLLCLSVSFLCVVIPNYELQCPSGIFHHYRSCIAFTNVWRCCSLLKALL